MKNLLILSVLISLIGIVRAQDTNQFHKNVVRVAIGPAWINTVPGIAFSQEYGREVSPLITISGSLTFAKAYEGIKNKSYYFENDPDVSEQIKLSNQSLISLNASGYFTPFLHEVHKFYFGGGAGINLYQEIYASNKENNLTFIHKNKIALGLNIVIGYSYKLNDKIDLGARASSIAFKNGTEMFMVTAGYHF